MTGMKSLRVLVGCETSGRVRRAFSDLGHDVWSCDLLPSEDGSNRHIVCDVRELLNDGWDLLAVMHPPCTRLCNSGVRWLSVPPRGRTLEEMWADLADGAALFSDCWNAPIERVAIENPVMHKHAKQRIRNYQPPAQTVQPWWFGDEALKATSFYLRGLPKLVATNRLTPPQAGTPERNRWAKVHRASPSKDRGRLRSVTYPGMALAIAHQWGGYAAEQVAA
ncbi:hypothetical protein GR238_34350 [Rhizobium leguminosarum]|nr:hypothetical protein [Rhizobium ruizarguesonis]